MTSWTKTTTRSLPGIKRTLGWKSPVKQIWTIYSKMLIVTVMHRHCMKNHSTKQTGIIQKKKKLQSERQERIIPICASVCKSISTTVRQLKISQMLVKMLPETKTISSETIPSTQRRGILLSDSMTAQNRFFHTRLIAKVNKKKQGKRMSMQPMPTATLYTFVIIKTMAGTPLVHSLKNSM